MSMDTRVTLEICHLAEAFGMRCEIHTSTTGPLEMANLHVSCAVRNCEWFEYFVPHDVFQFPMKESLPIDDKGWIHVPDKPGLGCELDWDAIEKGCVDYKVIKIKKHKEKEKYKIIQIMMKN